MNKKLNSALGILLGALLVITAFAVKSAVGAYFWIPLAIGLFVALFSIAEFALLLKKRGGDGNSEKTALPETKPLPEYRRKSTLLTRAEADAFEVLRELFGDKYEIFPQIPLVAVIDKITQNSYRNELFRVADFLIADKITFAPLILVELDDSSHMRADRAERDRKVREICSRARLPIVGFSPSDFRDPSYIKATIKKNILKK